MRQRKSYPKSFKSQVVKECQQPGVSVAAIAMSHGINANVVRRWLPLFSDQQASTLPAFIPLKVEAKRKVEALPTVELSLGQQTLTVKWLISDPEGCARFVRGLTQ
ncbi:IS66-like element accessory protein TnpA [Pseudomonas quasicaspiana]|uniref:IS66-like element accessory protein TnpA n=1 Tax=Pseudomonas quasicaspiana TaxID=2829821 RepID=UPI001E38F8ED|nr:transposase [Pseudomonas quasicaspiana]MCD5975602.1 transposase [Pseudomonas quasicaspiana]